MGREEVRFVSGEEQCAAWLFRPLAPAAPVPCVVMGSGLSCVRDQGMGVVAERFAAAGFAALAIDYRHFGDSGGEPRGLVSGSRQRDDLRAALAFARSRSDLDPARLVLWGYSLGGGNVQAVAAGEPGIAAAICVAPVVSGMRSLLHVGGLRHVARLMGAGLRDGARALRRGEPYRVPAAGPPGSLAALNSPDSAPGFAAITPPDSTWSNALCARVALAPPYSLARKVRRIECPTLYCITEEDDINPPELGKLAARRTPQGELRLYPGGHFDPFLGTTFEGMTADQIEFLRRHLDDGTIA
ncbi:MAG: alpha/beta hydrolase [Solirubrobacterales bacterium]